MDGIRHGDPFLWDVEEVVDELCTPGGRWIGDRAVLASKITEEEIDGRTLLTYEILYSRREMMECLGITTARRKAALAELIIELQSKSREFRSWKNKFLGKATRDSPVPRAEVIAQQTPSTLGHAVDRPAARESSLEPLRETLVKGKENVYRGQFDVLEESTSKVLENDESTVLKPQGVEGEGRSRDTISAPDDIFHDAVASHASPPPDDKASKQRRIAPLNLSNKPSIPARRQEDTVSTKNLYLGRYSLDVTLDSLPESDQNSSYSFSHIGTRILPTGQKLVTHRRTRRLLIKNSRKEAKLRQGIAVMRTPTPSDDDGRIFELDDIASEIDEETAREMEEEQAEIAEKEKERMKFLPHDRVEAILKEAVDEMTSKWEESKLPRLQHKAYKLWTDARRSVRTKQKIIEASQRAQHVELRMKKLCAEILKDTWQRVAEVRNQARVLEQSLEDKLHNLWLINLLESRTQPPKPDALPMPRRMHPRPLLSSLTDEEVLTSSDEDDFIVDDESEEVATKREIAEDEPNPHRYASPAGSEGDSDMFIDLTQLDSPEQLPNSEATRRYIDLRTPVKERRHEIEAESPHATTMTFEEPPPFNQLGSIQSIGQIPVTHWAKQKDRWRLTIATLFKLSHVRRQGVLQAILDQPAPEVWQTTVQVQLSQPITEDSQLELASAALIAFDMTRVFLGFLRCKQCTEDRIMTLEKKDKQKLQEARHSIFPSFCIFIRGIAAEFPQDSQIFRLDDFEEEMGPDDIDELMDDMDTPSKNRKRHGREIIQNKDAVDLRERERLRIQEQESRRLKLRAALAASDGFGHDQSRLIINESKQDDQSLIYVNKDIGTRIKDHQIEGVRFLWDQIMRDPQVRQGCLLAHTMGLGKTMQVITFLVAVQEAAMSDDETVRAQVPEDLRRSQTIIICPSGLVDNWMDELLLWAPEGLLSSLRKITAQLSYFERIATVRSWERSGGLLVIGYEMLKKVCDETDVGSLLMEAPNIVVADEAHTIKNPESKVHQVLNRFETPSRIALTGSPLSNHVLEYYTMISWVAPNFLGPVHEFRLTYANPIQQGLWSDSDGYEKRKALKYLEVLKQTVAPKVHRATMACLRDDLPPKYEFVISVEPTEIQKRLYNLYLQETAHLDGQARTFAAVNNLALVCNHPRCFRQKAMDVRSKVEDGNQTAFSDAMVSAVLKETKDPRLAEPAMSRKVELLLLILDEARQAKEKVLIFSQSIITLDYLENTLTLGKRRVCRLDGATKMEKRQDMIKGFNTGSQEVYLISTKAGGVGLNIHGANRVVIFDFKFNPVNDQQAVGRAYRIGQQRTVYVYRFIVAGSFEEQLQSKAVFKLQLASRVVDKKNPISWSKRLGSLLNPLRPPAIHDLSPFLHKDKVLDRLIAHSGEKKVITQIVSTDTFEEEDDLGRLTAEEKRDAEEMYKIESIRRTDPQAYQKLMDVRRSQEQAEEMASISSNQRSSKPVFAAGPAGIAGHRGPNAFTADNGSLTSANGHALSPSSLSSSHVPYTPGGRLQVPVSATQSQGPLSTPQMNVGAPQYQMPPPPLPIPGANTYFTKDHVDAQMNHTVTNTMTTTGAKQTAPSLKGIGLFQRAESHAKESFEAALQSCVILLPLSSPEMAKRVAQDITTSINKVFREHQPGFLPENQRWRFLERLLEHKRFIHSAYSGCLKPEFLALAKEDEVRLRLKTFNAISEQEFQALLRRAKTADPSVGSTSHS